MKPIANIRRALLGTLTAGAAFILPACSEPATHSPAAVAPPTPAQPAEVQSNAAPAPAPANPAKPTIPPVERTASGYRWGTAKITTPLPEGYPDPTAPGVIEVKNYPLVRRAEVTTTKPGVNAGMNSAFWPLFQHIQRRDIAMTSPVEMDYKGLTADAGAQPDAWTMSFLYRTPDLGPLGEDKSSKRHTVRINDLPPMTVAAIGFQGPYRLEVVKLNLSKLQAWLARNPEWEAAGDPRAMFYNGPEQWENRKWGEVQVPIKRVDAASAPG
ncbi:heme-binding protein [Aetokthonos hydrillicola]|jgi:hypothetical protein|uniref:heme-binding protein n=1 Tax=Aetokthonos hydrillicola TaxID=1550245 RepID=UPI001ABB9445|nr:heme-binding protein [Aetokthonos hydrillicola]MBO3464152.1 hypothetical protein [Aetokthonos hydrillicola CCALA 1050]